MHHFFLTPDSIQGQTVTFPRQTVHQIKNVLRLHGGDQVAVLDNSGKMYTVVLAFDPVEQSLTGQIVATEPVSSEPDIHLALFFGMSSREKMEMILQKCTEIGVGSFHPFISSRTLVNTTTYSKSKYERWMRIIQEAAEQSGRGRLPVMIPPDTLENSFLKASRDYDLSLMAWEQAEADGFKLEGLRDRFSGRSIALFVGPEGGFSDDEAAKAKEVSCQIVSLGARILRMETAAIVFPALVLHELGMS